LLYCFHIHRQILFAANSGYFGGLLEAVVEDSASVNLEIPEKSFEAVKNYLYNNPSEINHNNVFDVIVEANKVDSYTWLLMS
jgi:hypothetical protein